MNSIKAPQVQKVKASKSPGPSCPLWNSAPKAKAKADALRHVFSWQREAMACQNGNILLHINPVLKSVRQKPVVVKSRKMSKEWYLGWRWANVIAKNTPYISDKEACLSLSLSLSLRDAVMWWDRNVSLLGVAHCSFGGCCMHARM